MTDPIQQRLDIKCIATKGHLRFRCAALERLGEVLPRLNNSHASATPAVHCFHQRLSSGAALGKRVLRQGRSRPVPEQGHIAGLRDFLGACFVAEHRELSGVGPTKAMPAASQASAKWLCSLRNLTRVKRCCASVNCCLNDGFGVEIAAAPMPGRRTDASPSRTWAQVASSSGYTVTTAYPWSRAVAARRTAISPRLAMRSVFFMRIGPLLNA